MSILYEYFKKYLVSYLLYTVFKVQYSGLIKRMFPFFLVSHINTKLLLCLYHWLSQIFYQHYPVVVGYTLACAVLDLYKSFRFLFFLIWRPPTFPYRLQYSIIGRLSLNHRVRDGYGCFP